jgi:DNA replication protein DnaC
VSGTTTAPIPEGAPACEQCGRPLEPLTVDLPLRLGSRTWFGECACAEARREAQARERQLEEHRARVRRLLGQSGIGLRHREASFENFVVTPATGPLASACCTFAERFPDDGAGLTLAGPPGTGKTHLGVAITRRLIDHGHAAVIVNVPQLLLTARGTFAHERPQRFDDLLQLLTTCDHLTLDDLGRERQTEWAQETLYLILNARYEDRRATTITTNLDLEALRRRIGEPVLDRLAETNRAYWCQWPSYRRRGES